MDTDLRQWLTQVEKMGELAKVEEANWDREIGCIAALNVKRKDGPALLFDNIKGYPPGYRILTSSTLTPRRVALTLNLQEYSSDLKLISVLRQKLPEWESNLDRYPPEVVKSGPVLENVLSGADVDLLKFPVPKWHDLDGGRYIGTGDAVITTDPDTHEVNLGTYRIQVHDRKTAGIFVVPGHHGRVHYEKYHARGERCPIAVSLGHHPLVFRVACVEVPSGVEYAYLGAIRQKPVKVIKEEITGLPIPADSEIVIAGWCPPGKTKTEGPFGEWTGYYASKELPAPVIEVERIYHRNNPIILGSQNDRPPSDGTYLMSLMLSATLQNEMAKNGIPDVKGVWYSTVAGRMLIVISIKQRYAGHAKQAALYATQSRVAHSGRYVIVVDEDIDPTNIEDVLWAMCTRSNPETDIDIIRRAWSSPIDPMVRKPTKVFFNTRAIIDACKPYEWFDEFPQDIRLDPELVAEVKAKWKGVLGNE